MRLEVAIVSPKKSLAPSDPKPTPIVYTGNNPQCRALTLIDPRMAPASLLARFLSTGDEQNRVAANSKLLRVFGEAG
jgi:hypothetical protein